MKLSIIIVNYNTKDDLRGCLGSIFKAFRKSQLDYEMFVVDNNSSDGSQEMVKKEFPSVNLIENKENLGFAKANNQAIRVAKGRYLLLLNPDTVVIPKSLDSMVEFMEKNQRIGILGPKLVDSNSSLQFSVSKFSTPFTVFFHFCLPRTLSTKFKNYIAKTNFKKFLGGQINTYFLPRNAEFSTETDFVSGACLLIRKKVVEQIGLLDERFFLYIEDVDWCFRTKKKGWKIIYFPKAKIVHYGGSTTGGDFKPFPFCCAIESEYYYFKKHFKRITCFIVKLLLLSALIIRFPQFLSYIRKKDKNSDLWKKYQKTFLKIFLN